MKLLLILAALALSASFSILSPAIAAQSQAKAESKAQVTQLSAQEIVPELVALGLKPTVYKVAPQRMQELYNQQDRYILHITLGRLSADQFAKVKALYGGYSQVPYDQNRAYDLIDFLPPAMQAVVNKTFTSDHYNTEKLWDIEIDQNDPDIMDFYALRKNGISTFTNCWGTTMEILKSLRTSPGTDFTYTISWPARWTADDMFKDAKLSSKVRVDHVRIGDVLVVSHMDTIQHTAIVLGKNLVFEKTDSSDNDAYRLSVRADLDAKYKEVFEGKGKITYRRFSADKEPIPNETPMAFTENIKKILLKVNPELPVNSVTVGCETALGGGCDMAFTEIGFVKLKVDPKTGRGYLSGDSKLMNHFVEL